MPSDRQARKLHELEPWVCGKLSAACGECGVTRGCCVPCCAGFEAETEDEVSVALGEEVTVHVEVEGWVQVTRARDGRKGLVPASYIGAAGS